MKTEDLQIDTLKSVGVTQIIPEDWEDWIWTDLSDGAPFSWGDNNHSLVDALSFGAHLTLILAAQGNNESVNEHRIPIMDTIKDLHKNNIFIDLES